jgi:DNA-binding CsgD family transcriptional regulator
VSTAGVAGMPVGAVVPSLVRWGVSPDADLVYRALLTIGPQPAGQLSRDLGIAPRRVSAALEELRAHDAVTPSHPTGSGRTAQLRVWLPSSPEEVVHRLRRARLRIIDPLEQAERHLATIEGMELPTDVAHAERGQARLLRGIDLIRQRIADLAAEERHEHLAINPEPTLSAPATAAAAPLDRALLRRGGALLTLGVPPADGDNAGMRNPELERLGALHRVAGELPLKAMVFDRRIAILPLNPLNPGNGVLEIADTRLVRGIVSLFAHMWQRARDPHHPDVPMLTLSKRERTIVALLAAGHTDRTVSRRLGVSTRTIGYVVRGLMDRLNVENRFQLGLALGTQAIHPFPPSKLPTAAGQIEKAR